MCVCERQERLEATHPTLAKRRPWEWEDRNGCREPVPGGNAGFYWDGVPLARCPRALVEPWAWEYLALFGPYKAGNLPLAGGVLDQPARLLDALQAIEGTLAQIRADRHDETARSRDTADGFTAESPVKPSIRRSRGRR